MSSPPADPWPLIRQHCLMTAPRVCRLGRYFCRRPFQRPEGTKSDGATSSIASTYYGVIEGLGRESGGGSGITDRAITAFLRMDSPDNAAIRPCAQANSLYARAQHTRATIVSMCSVAALGKELLNVFVVIRLPVPERGVSAARNNPEALHALRRGTCIDNLSLLCDWKHVILAGNDPKARCRDGSGS